MKYDIHRSQLIKTHIVVILSVRVYYRELLFICGMISSVQDPVTGDEISVYPAIRRFFKMSGSFSVMLFMVRSFKVQWNPNPPSLPDPARRSSHAAFRSVATDRESLEQARVTF